MTGHIGAGNAEFCDLSDAIHSLCRRTRRRQIEKGTIGKIRRKPLEIGFPDLAGEPIRAVTGGAIATEKSLSAPCVSRGDGDERWMPEPLCDLVLLNAGSMQAFEVSDKIVSPPVTKEKRVGRHDRCPTDFRRIVKMRLEPQGRTAPTDFGE